MAISYIASGTGITSVSSMPSHTAGDYLIGCAFRDGNNTAPTLPAGWTELPSGSSLGAGANSNGMRLGYKVAASSGETSGTWTSATSLNIDCYRGVGSIGNVTQNEGSGVALNYPANTFTVTDGTSWAVLYCGHRSANTTIETPPTGATNRSDNVDATDELVTHDTNGGVTGWSSTNQTVTGTSSGWRTVVVELVAASSAVTGTITQTLPKLAQSVTASRAFNASVAQTLPRLAQAVTASRAFNATVAQALPRLAQAASASLTFTASAAQTLPKLAQAASALLTFTASAAQTLPRLAQAIAASLTFSGSAAQTLPKLAQEATADVVISGFAGTAEQTLPSLQQAATATTTVTETAPDTYWHVTQEEIERYWRGPKKVPQKQAARRKKLVEEVKQFKGKEPSHEDLHRLATAFFPTAAPDNLDIFAANVQVAIDRAMRSMLADLAAQQVAESEARRLEAIWLIEDAILKAFAQYEQMLEDDELLAMFVM